MLIFKVTNKPKGGAMSKQEDDGITRIYGAKNKNEGKVVSKQKNNRPMHIYKITNNIRRILVLCNHDLND